MEPYVGEIRLFAGSYAPRGWAFCNGAELSIQQNTLLFSVIGNQFGGDGVNTFYLPDLRGRVPMHQGQGTGLTERPFASKGGDAAVALDASQMPAHNHVANSVSTTSGTAPTDAVWANSTGFGAKPMYTNTPNVTMNSLAIGSSGGSQPHNNMQPYLAINFIIALEGTYPEKTS